MKLIIKIDNETYKGLLTDSHIFVKHILDAVRNGTPIPDNATNGDVIKKMFPNVNVYEHNGGATYSVNNEYNFNATWWSAPYQKGGKDEN